MRAKQKVFIDTKSHDIYSLWRQFEPWTLRLNDIKHWVDVWSPGECYFSSVLTEAEGFDHKLHYEYCASYDLSCQRGMRWLREHFLYVLLVWSKNTLTLPWANIRQSFSFSETLRRWEIECVNNYLWFTLYFMKMFIIFNIKIEINSV